jgi:acyl-CoA synthetase (AMP-forming)/AMP-acid ligase II
MVVADHIGRAAQCYPDHVAAICDGERRSHGEIDERSNRFANALLKRGLVAGERVVVLLDNSIRCIEIDFGLAKAALVRVSLNPRITAPELEYILRDAEPSAILFGSNFAALVAPVVSCIKGLREKIRVAEPGSPAPDSAATDYETMLADASPELPSVRAREDDLHSIAYTSGSTGRPKGVMLTHRAIVQVAYNVLLELGPEQPGEKVLLLQPLSHGSAYFVLAYYMRGCAVVLMRQFNAERVVRLLRELEIETAKLVPTMLQRILALPGLDQAAFPRLRQIVYGGSHIATDVLGKAIAVFGPRLAQHYGQSEAPSTLTLLPRHVHTRDNLESGLLSSAGRPWATVEARIANETGEGVAPGEVGELLVRAPHVMTGYWKRPDLSAVALRDGWLHTNDLGRMDARGFVYLLGRKDEMIISGGFNIAPREVEDALCNHPAVVEAAVLGKPDTEWGQIVVAFVSSRDKSVTQEELAEFTRPALGYKRPKQIVILDELPKNPNGKIDKAALKRVMIAQ